MVAPDPALEAERFEQRYAASGSRIALAIECAALGTDYQANGYSTVEQVQEMGRALHLHAGLVLLDLGAGCGWPGLYLAGRHGCAVVSTDTIASGAATAQARARADGIADRAWPVLADAAMLPLRPASIDAVVHTDLMC